jgi:hydroxyacylglutathione hydrolase
MKIERFEVPGLAQYSYVVSSDGQAIVIDPVRDERYFRYLQQNQLQLVFVVETHIHADFVSGAKALAEATGAELAVSAYDEREHYQYSMPHRALHNGDSISVGAARLEALHTPGHTPEHLSFVLYNDRQSTVEPLALFTGDFLFVGSVGRPDLLGEEAKLGLAHELFHSMHSRLEALPDTVRVYPGHGAGSLCGSGMSEQAESTLGDERRDDPLFQLDEEAFVAEVLGSVPPMPTYYPRMKSLNARGAKPSGSVSNPKPLSADQVETLLKEESVIALDLRRAEAFGGTHLPGAINIGAGQNLSLWAGWLLSPDSNFILVNDNGYDAESRLALLRVGLDNILGYLAGGMPAWIDAGKDWERTTQLSTTEVQQRSSNDLVLDVRSDAEWASGHIAGAQHLMLGDLPVQLASIPKQHRLITVCGSGYRSSIAASLLAAAGYRDVSSMNGGMAAWNRRGLPLE